jgi:hypothetical protein
MSHEIYFHILEWVKIKILGCCLSRFGLGLLGGRRMTSSSELMGETPNA